MRASQSGSIGQLLMVGLEEERWSPSTERLLRAWQPGGLLLSARHLATPGGAAELLRRITRALPVPPFLALEEEGGARDPLRALFPPLPSPRAAAQQSPAAVTCLGNLAGAALKLLGFNTHLAPVLDLAAPSSGQLLRARAFGSEAKTVAECGRAFLRGLKRHNILACGKHFPGLGSAQTQPASPPLTVGKTMVELWRQDLIPYRRLQARLPLLLLSHAAYKAYDFDLPCPAALSASIATGLLRVKLGYRGVAAADNREADPIRQTFDPGEAAVRSLLAGCDLLLVGPRRQSIEAALGALRNSLEAGKLSVRRVEEALGRVRAAKRRLTRPEGKLSQRAFERLCREFEHFGKQCPVQESIGA
jgi:beta-N-acetylhexosaminidase